MRILYIISVFLFAEMFFLSSCSLERQIFQSLSQNDVAKNEQKEVNAVDTSIEQEPMVMTRYQNVSSYFVLQDKEPMQAKAEQLLASKNKSFVHLVKEMSSIQKAIQATSSISTKKQKDKETEECDDCGFKSIMNGLLFLFIGVPLIATLFGIPLGLLLFYWSVKNGNLAMKSGNKQERNKGTIGLLLSVGTIFLILLALMAFLS